jgi:hypothetical protein
MFPSELGRYEENQMVYVAEEKMCLPYAFATIVILVAIIIPTFLLLFPMLCPHVSAPSVVLSGRGPKGVGYVDKSKGQNHRCPGWEVLK